MHCIKQCEKCKNMNPSCFKCGNNKRCQGCYKYFCYDCSNKINDESDGSKSIICNHCTGIFQDFSLYLHCRERNQLYN